VVSYRLEQMASAIERGVQQVIVRGFHDPRISGLITVTGVRVLPDMSQVSIGISVFPEEKEELTFHGLVAAASFIRREVGELIVARHLPEFVFTLDRSLKKQAAIFRELDRAKAELAILDEHRAANAPAASQQGDLAGVEQPKQAEDPHP